MNAQDVLAKIVKKLRTEITTMERRVKSNQSRSSTEVIGLLHYINGLNFSLGLIRGEEEDLLEKIREERRAIRVDIDPSPGPTDSGA